MYNFFCFGGVHLWMAQMANFALPSLQKKKKMLKSFWRMSVVARNKIQLTIDIRSLSNFIIQERKEKKKTFLLNLFLARRLVPFCLHNLDPRRAGFWRMGRNSGHLFVLHWRLHFIGLCCSCADHLVPRLL